MGELKGSEFKKADLRVGVRLYRNGQRNNVFSIRSIDRRPGLAARGFEAELYQDNGTHQKAVWLTLSDIKRKFTLLT